MSRHTHRLAAPRNYPILRKTAHYVVTIGPGPHPKRLSLPLLLVLRDVLKLADTQKEIKHILNEKKVFVDGAVRTDMKFPIGFMDALSLPKIKENFRVLLNRNGTLNFVKINDHEAKLKLCKIMNKTALSKGRIQLNLHDGRNIIAEDGKYKTGDSILISLPDQKITKHMAFEKGTHVYIVAGKHIGEAATLVDFHSMAGSTADRAVLANENGDNFETLKKYVFVLGKEKPEIKVHGEHEIKVHGEHETKVHGEQSKTHGEHEIKTHGEQIKTHGEHK